MDNSTHAIGHLIMVGVHIAENLKRSLERFLTTILVDSLQFEGARDLLLSPDFGWVVMILGLRDSGGRRALAGRAAL